MELENYSGNECTVSDIIYHDKTTLEKLTELPQAVILTTHREESGEMKTEKYRYSENAETFELFTNDNLKSFDK